MLLIVSTFSLDTDPRLQYLLIPAIFLYDANICMNFINSSYTIPATFIWEKPNAVITSVIVFFIYFAVINPSTV